MNILFKLRGLQVEIFMVYSWITVNSMAKKRYILQLVMINNGAPQIFSSRHNGRIITRHSKSNPIELNFNGTQSNSIGGLNSIEFGNRTKSNSPKRKKINRTQSNVRFSNSWFINRRWKSITRGGYLGQFLLGMCRWPLGVPTPL